MLSKAHIHLHVVLLRTNSLFLIYLFLYLFIYLGLPILGKVAATVRGAAVRALNSPSPLPSEKDHYTRNYIDPLIFINSGWVL